MSSTLPGSHRHQRQRSSVSVKKRTSLSNDQDVQDNALSTAPRDAPDNRLSPAQASLTHSRHPSLQSRKANNLSSPSEEHEDVYAANKAEAAQTDHSFASTDDSNHYQPPSQDYFSLGSPYPGKQAGRDGRMESLYGTGSDAESGGMDHQSLLSNGDSSGLMMGETTTRTELDLFDEEEDDQGEEPIQSSSAQSSQTSAPAVPPKEMSRKDDSSPPVIPTKPQPESGSNDARSNSPIPSMTLAATPARERGQSGLGGTRRLSLLSGSALGPSSSAAHHSPTVSPSSSRMVTPNGASTSASTTPVRRVQMSKRMSLGYVPSPTSSKLSGGFNGSKSYECSTPSATETPPLASASTAGGSYFTRLNGGGSIPNTPPSAPPIPLPPLSAAATSPNATRLTKKEDGDTVMTQHKDILTRIAEKERTVFELKERLQREEGELKGLQIEWQKSVNREMASEGSSRLAPNNHGSSRAASPTHAISVAPTEGQGSEDNARRGGAAGKSAGSVPSGQNQPLPSVATEGWKAFSARLTGASTQFNAFIDQLAAPPLEEEEKRPEESGRMGGTGLDVLEEEAEEGDGTLDSGRSTVAPAVPSKTPATAASSQAKQARRTSMFGSSMAALQKQMEAQFAPVPGNERPPSKDSTSGEIGGGWGSWQKRIKEARENASGLLAKAEARLGQALTIDDLLEEAQSPNAKTGPGSHSNVNSIQTAASTGGFSDENDREKAALAELSWLNSLAGISMSGTTDRVTTSVSVSPDSKAKRALNSQNVGQLDRSTSSSSQTSKRASSTSHSTSTTNATTTNWPTSPLLSASGGGAGEEEAKQASSGSGRRDSNGFFSMLSTAWGAEKVGMQAEEGRRSSSSSSSNVGSGGVTAGGPSRHHRQASNGQNKTRMAVKMAMEESNRVPAQQDSSGAKVDGEEDDAWAW